MAAFPLAERGSNDSRFHSDRQIPQLEAGPNEETGRVQWSNGTATAQENRHWEGVIKLPDMSNLSAN